MEEYQLNAVSAFEMRGVKTDCHEKGPIVTNGDRAAQLSNSQSNGEGD